MPEKDLIFEGSSYEDLLEFPDDAKREAGYQLGFVQNGQEPDDWKPIKCVGPGVNEIRIRVEGAFRVIYIAKYEEAAYVLHAFQKKSQKTPKKDIDIAKKRLRRLEQERTK